MEGKELGELLLVTEDCAHVGLECIHVLAYGDLMLLGLGSEVVESLLLNEGAIGKDEAELLDRALIDEFIVIVGLRGFFTGPATFRTHFSLFSQHWARATD